MIKHKKRAVASAKKYTNSGKVTVALRTFLARMRLQGESFLPSERQLSEKLQCSRVVLRKVLGEFEARGELLKGAKGRIIASVQPVMRVVLATIGDEAINGYSWNHLWSVLEALARTVGIAMELVLYSEASPLTIKKLGCNLPDALIFTSKLQESEYEMLNRLRTKLPIISVDGAHAGVFDYAVTLDDYNVGAQAAELLKKNGYRNPAFIGLDNNNYLPFRLRRNGFCDVFDAVSVKIAVVDGVNQVLKIKAMTDAVKQLIQEGVDSIFLYSDEFVDFIFQAIAEECSMPDEFGLVTLNGSGHALAHNPQITAFSHMIPEIAQQLISILNKINQQQLPSTLKMAVKAENIFNGTTVRTVQC
jgi:DNA-binding LacI/PurR family transcriptional regulator